MYVKRTLPLWIEQFSDLFEFYYFTSDLLIANIIYKFYHLVLPISFYVATKLVFIQTDFFSLISYEAKPWRESIEGL